MSVRLETSVIYLEGDCHLEEAERLVALLSEATDRTVDVSLCRRMHAAVLQTLISLGAAVSGAPEDRFLRDFVLPNLGLAQGAAERSTDAAGNLEY